MIGRLTFITMITISGLYFIFNQADKLPDSPILISRPAEPMVRATSQEKAVEAAVVGDEEGAGLFIFDDDSQWAPGEMALVKTILVNSAVALDEVGLDGQELIDGYRFQRVANEHIDEELGLVALINHESRIISLADAAFVRMGGFYIYHEIGHLVDRQLDRALSEHFHDQIGSGSSEVGEVAQWQTAAGYWLRAHAHQDREEATADAFALWVSSQQSDIRRPIFAGQPLDADYDSIILSLANALHDLSAA